MLSIGGKEGFQSFSTGDRFYTRLKLICANPEATHEVADVFPHQKNPPSPIPHVDYKPLLEAFAGVRKPKQIESCSQGCCGTPEEFLEMLTCSRERLTWEQLWSFVMHYSTTVEPAG